MFEKCTLVRFADLVEGVAADLGDRLVVRLPKERARISSKDMCYLHWKFGD